MPLTEHESCHFHLYCLISESLGSASLYYDWFFFNPWAGDTNSVAYVYIPALYLLCNYPLHSFTPFFQCSDNIYNIFRNGVFKFFEELRLGTMVFSIVGGKFILIRHIKKFVDDNSRQQATI